MTVVVHDDLRTQHKILVLLVYDAGVWLVPFGVCTDKRKY